MNIDELQKQYQKVCKLYQDYAILGQEKQRIRTQLTSKLRKQLNHNKGKNKL